MKLWKNLFVTALTVTMLLPSALACQHTVVDAPAFQTSPWATADIEAAAGLGLLGGELESYDLRTPITRNEFRKLAMSFVRVQTDLACLEDMVRFSLSEKDEAGKMVLVFHDKPEEPDRLTDTENSIAYYLGLVEGRGDGIFDPDAPITREEAAVMLLRAYQVIGRELSTDVASVSFSDQSVISSWAMESVSILRAWDILKGKENGIFDPKGTFTREQCVVTFLRMYENAPVSRAHSNVKPLFSYEEILSYYEALYLQDPLETGQAVRGQLGRWEGSNATMIHDALEGGTISPASTFFIYQDGRVRYFDIGLCTVWQMLTSSVKLEDGHYSEDGLTFFCTAVLPYDITGDDGSGTRIIYHEAGTYHISVDVETLVVRHQWETLDKR